MIWVGSSVIMLSFSKGIFFFFGAFYELYNGDFYEYNFEYILLQLILNTLDIVSYNVLIDIIWTKYHIKTRKSRICVGSQIVLVLHYKTNSWPSNGSIKIFEIRIPALRRRCHSLTACNAALPKNPKWPQICLLHGFWTF